MNALPATTSRQIAALGDATKRRRSGVPKLPDPSRRSLRLMELRDGRANLVEASGEIFMPCATVEVARRMRAVFSR